VISDANCVLPQCGRVAESTAHKTSYSWYFVLAFSRRFADCYAKMNMPIEFRRRLGPDPHANGVQTYALVGCPDILELDGGDFAVIGSDITADAAGKLPSSVSCGPDERIIRIPRRTLVLAKPDIPDKL
jgi:hypothetical protein